MKTNTSTNIYYNHRLSTTYILISLYMFFQPLYSCKRLVTVPSPVNSITTAQVFSTDGQATDAAASMYYYMINSTMGIDNSAMTFFGGLSADELLSFNQSGSNAIAQFQLNTIPTNNTYIYNNIWLRSYNTIYAANSIIGGLQDYAGVHDSVKNELTGEAEFVRAFCFFYLVNLFGDVPLPLTIDYNKTSLLSRSPSRQVYSQILDDLKDAQNRLASDYSVGNGERIVPNKWAATALMARVYLYLNRYDSAEIESSLLINNFSLYSLEPDLKNVFLTTSQEAIWQLKQDNSGATPAHNATYEGFKFALPPKSTASPTFYLTSEFLSTFDSGDNRKNLWIDSTTYLNKVYYLPYKYKTGLANNQVNGSYTEYYMVLRLAEQYLIRAEARAQQKKFTDAINDLNNIRNRAALPSLSDTLNQSQVLAAVAHERRIELFAEWGHRWLDLKRTGQATNTLSPYKQNWTPNAILYPIPISELIVDHNLTQNPGYQ